MRKTINILVCLVTTSFLSAILNAQPLQRKKLNQQLSQAKTDTAKVNCLNNIALAFLSNNNDSALYFSQKALKISVDINYVNGKAKAYINMANAYRHLDSTQRCLAILNIIKKEKLLLKITNTTEQEKTTAEWLYAKARIYENLDSFAFAKKLYLQSEKICEKQNYTFLLSKNYTGLKFIASKQNNFTDALRFAFKSIAPLEKIKDSLELCKTYNNISHFYGQINEHEKANKFRVVALDMAFKINRLDLASLYYCNIGIGYHELGYKELRNYDTALFYANKSLGLAEKINDTKRKITAMSLIGSCYLNTQQYDKSLSILRKGLGLANTLNDNYYKISISDHIGELYQKTGRLDSAIYYGKKSLGYSKEINMLQSMQWGAETLMKSYQLNGDFKNAFEMQMLFYKIRDSIYSTENTKELINQELNYKYEKQALADSLKYDADKKITEVSNKSSLKAVQTRLGIVAVGLIMMIVVGFILFNRFRVTQKQKQIIETQTKNIQDSISYSKDIQNVFLKPLAYNKSYFKNSHLIYKPKDVVSGDFYWHKEINDNLFIVVGDCTGHGVPGAIISVLAIQYLDKLVPLISSPKNLHQLNAMLREEFNVYYSQDSRVSIGLDYSVLCINKTEKNIYFSGSGAAILIKDTAQKVIVERFDSINIGGRIPAIYNAQTVVYQSSAVDTICLYTDGIIDQKGGLEKKKFGTNQLKKLLENTNIHNSDIKIKLDTALAEWRGNEEQIDDMTLLALEIKSA